MGFPDLILPADLAVWDPLGGNPEPAMTGHTGIAVHTMAGSFAGTDSFFHQGGWTGTESTVGVAGSGFCKQWVSWGRQADANLDLNGLWLSIECADAGESFPPLATASDSSPPLTAAQIERIIRLCVYWCDKRNHAGCPAGWRCRTDGIPARFASSSCQSGIGTHRAGIDPWRPLGCPKTSAAGGKICPRSVRLAQVRDIIVPEVARRLAGVTPPPEGDWFDMATEEDLHRVVRQELLPRRCIAEDFVDGTDPVVLTDPSHCVWKHEIEFRGVLDAHVKAMLAAHGVEGANAAIRLPRALLDALPEISLEAIFGPALRDAIGVSMNVDGIAADQMRQRAKEGAAEALNTPS